MKLIPTTRMELWHPDSPGIRVDVDVRWPRALWLRYCHAMGGDNTGGRYPIGFATTSEVLRKYDRDGVGLRPVRYRLLCWMLGHRVVRHITAVDLPGPGVAIVNGTAGWIQQVKPTDWYFQCSRCRRTASRDWTDRAGALEHRPVWLRFEVRR